MNRSTLQRTAYALAALATLMSAGGLAGFSELLSTFSRSGQLWPLMTLPLVVAGGFLALVAAAFGYLAWKPRRWGKFLCAIGAPWIMFSLIAPFVMQMGGLPLNPLLLLPGIAGAMLLVIGLFLFVVDRRPATATS